jgi:PAS domain S-box-containing protein
VKIRDEGMQAVSVQKDRDRPNDLGELRQRAEAAWRKCGSDAVKLSADDVPSLVHELEVHQIQLEMQNEELRQAQEKLEAARDKYTDLYDFAPAAHLTVDENGQILEANLTAARLLGTERGVLLGKSLSRFISPEDQDVYYKHGRAVLAAKKRQTCEVRMVTRGGTRFDSQMQSVGISDNDGTVTKWRTVISDVTEQKRAEKALQSSERKYRSLFDEALDMIHIVDRDYRLTDINATELATLGYSREECIGRPLIEIIHSDYWERTARVLKQLFAGYKIDPYETAFVARKGDTIMVEVSAFPQEMNGEIVSARAICRDISERKRAEEALRVRDRAMTAAANGIVLTDWTRPDNPIIYCNPAFEKISGYTLDEALGRNLRFLQGDDREQEGLEEVRAAIQAGRECHVVVRNYRKDGTLFWNDLTISPVRGENGQVTHFVGIENDITESRRAEAALLEREQQLGLILASTDEGIYGMDQAGRFTFANCASVRMLGYRDEQALLGKDAHALIHHTRADGTARAKEDCRICQARCENKVVHLDDELLWRADGSSFPVDYRSHPMVRDGEVVGTVVSFTDITERKEKEAQLLQAQKMEVVGQLTGGIAHDFNNLLTVILANLGLLGDQVASDAGASTRELIDDALSAARDGAELTRRLLAFSHKQPLQVRRVDIGEFLRNARRFLQRTLREDIELRIPRAKEVPPVLVDPSQFESALLNLVVNARDAMPKGGTLIIETTRKCIGADEATADPELAPGNYVMITVRDSGMGMSPEDAARAIEPFFTTKRRGKGSGLGLSMVYGFARQSGGGLLLRSVPGEGTTVSMLLPEAAPVMEKEDAEPTPRNMPGGCERILLVEDELQIRNVTKRIFSGLGYEVIAVENAAAAMKVFEAGAAADLLFSDIVMPGPMHGCELARWALQRYSGLKVLLTTGFSEDEVGELPVDTGRVHLLRKPYTKKELAAAIRAVFDGEAACSPHSKLSKSEILS